MNIEQNAQFEHRWLPLLIALPQLLIVFVFFYWPSGQALQWSMTLEKPFGGESIFVGLDNFRMLLNDVEFYFSVAMSLIFTLAATGLAIGFALILAVTADRKIRGIHLYRNALIWPYAIAPPVAGVALQFLMHPQLGVFSAFNELFPGLWNPALNGADAMLMVIFAFAWLNIPFNFIFFLAGLQAIPDDYIQAADMDGAGSWRKLLDIQLPLLTPFFFFVLIINITESFTQSFGIIHTMTQGGPGGATTILVYKIYTDGFIGQDLSGSSAQSVLLLLLIALFTIVQFRYIERRVHYLR